MSQTAVAAEAQTESPAAQRKPNNKDAVEAYNRKCEIKIPEKGIFLGSENPKHTCDLFVTRILDQGFYFTLSDDIPKETPIGQVFAGGIMVKAVKISRPAKGQKLPLVRFGIKAPKFLAVKKEEHFDTPYKEDYEYIKSQIDMQKKLNPLDQYTYYSNVLTALLEIRESMDHELNKLRKLNATFKDHRRHYEYEALDQQKADLRKQLRIAQDKKAIAKEALDQAKNSYSLKYAENLLSALKTEMTVDELTPILAKVKAKTDEDTTEVEQLSHEQAEEA